MRATILSGLALLLAIAALRLRLPERRAVRRGIPGASLFLGFVALALTLSEALQAPYFRWNDPRLAPTAAIFAGWPHASQDHDGASLRATTRTPFTGPASMTPVANPVL